MEGCFWQYNQHLPIRIQQEMQESEVKLASSKQKKRRNATTVFITFDLISQLVVVFLENK